MKSSVKIFSVTVLLIASLIGCAKRVVPDPILLSSVRGTSLEARKIPMSISKSDLRRALLNEELNQKTRIVQIFTRADEGGGSIPQYRLFDVRPGSVYALLGLQSADLLIGAHGYVIKSPLAFRKYVSLLPGESASLIEIMRAGESVVLEYAFHE